MGLTAMEAVSLLHDELTTDEFRLLTIISWHNDISDEYLFPNWDKVLLTSGYTKGQIGRMLRGLVSGGIIRLYASNTVDMMSIADARSSVPLCPCALWITGMAELPVPPKPIFYSKTKIPNDIRVQVFKRDGYQCQHCGSADDLSVDHIHPESKGGKLEIDNLQTLCRSCNSKKGVKVS